MWEWGGGGHDAAEEIRLKQNKKEKAKGHTGTDQQA